MIPSRTQSSLAVSADGSSWFLVNASPDLRTQLMQTPGLQPAAGSGRGIPLEGVLLTNSDIDHTLGVVLLREDDAPAHVHATVEVQRKLGWMDELLKPMSGLCWHEPPAMPEPLLCRDGRSSGLTYEYFSLQPADSREESIAYVLTDEHTGSRVLVAPDVGGVSEQLRDQLGRVAAVFWDGTFWTGDELSRLVRGKRSAVEMGHLPLSEGGLDALAQSRAALKVLIHLNNTNPVLLPDSAQRHEVESRGVHVGEDGMLFDV
ncbi:MAG: pqqB [Prosthecobacter sp.]|nr:pqqB [Prosthecobacter sp.]